jgi:UDP-N-acetyl-D-galactosamine dehydrogenase
MENNKIAVIGLGYVGLPLAVEFGKIFKTFGFDINQIRINELREFYDRTLETNYDQILESKYLSFVNNLDEIASCNIYIVTVPTPIDNYKAPDLRPLKSATKMIGTILKKGDVVIFESTVFPGCTEEECVPILEGVSGLRYNIDFFCGYSPERINPGDKVNTLTKIKKVTSGSNKEVANFVDKLYGSIISAGTFLATSIKVAEASKAIENAQRDINISFINELAIIFDRLNIDTHEVLEAAGTKWNFLKYKPGLVGGHCIGVDPYYLAFKAQSVGYYPQVILSGRRVNDNMGVFVANKVLKLLIQNNLTIKGAKVLILGITFKENCPDIRNSKVIDIYQELLQFGLDVDVFDPIANEDEVYNTYAIKTISKLLKYDGVVLAVEHECFRVLNLNEIKKNDSSIIFDTKSFFPKELVNGRL